MDRKAKVMVVGSVLLFALAVCLGVVTWALHYQSRSGTEKPNAADWMQGWGTIFGLVVTIIGAAVAGLVYRESLRATRISEERRREDRAEAEAAARLAAQRWNVERDQAARQLQAIQHQVASERRRYEEARREAELVAPRAVLVTRIGPAMRGHGELRQVAVTVQNYSAQPVRGVSCAVRIKLTGYLLGTGVPVLGPGQRLTPAWNARDDQPVTVPADEAPVWDLDTDSIFWSVTLRFIDATGQAWERVDNGEPVKVSTNFPPAD